MSLHNYKTVTSSNYPGMKVSNGETVIGVEQLLAYAKWLESIAPVDVIRCNGYKCRRSECISCFGDDAYEYITQVRERIQKLC